MTDAPEWAWDDPSIADSERLLRRVPDGLYQSAAVIDSESGDREVGPAMLRYDYADQVGSEQEGLSVHRELILEERGRTAADAYPAPNRAMAFSASAVREADPRGGVVPQDDPDEEDEDLRAAHALVRLSEPLEQPKKKHPVWNRFRSALADRAEWATDEVAEA